MSIFTWNEFCQQLWAEAAESRGTVTSLVELPGAGRHSTISEWPRTSGEDVIAIVSLIDPVFGELPLRPGGYGITRLWQAAVIEVEEHAFSQPHAEYAHNRTLWSTIIAVVAHLELIGARVPSDDELHEVLDGLWELGEGHRNGGAPVTSEVTESTVEKMWDAQHAEMKAARGFDLREPSAGSPGRRMQVPRTTNADVIRLAGYWNQQLAKLLVKVMMGSVSNTMGLTGEQERWRVAAGDVEQLAKSGRADDVYAKNHEFWRASLSLATTLGVLGEVPSPYDLMLASTKQAVADLPSKIADAAGSVAHAIGTIAHEAGAGLISGVGKPLLLGGSVLVGLFLLLRSGRSRGAA